MAITSDRLRQTFSEGGAMEIYHEIIYEFADTSLLPDDFDKKSPDNMILSVALKYKKDNPIMLTSDNGLQLKSKIFNISTVSLKNFLKR